MKQGIILRVFGERVRQLRIQKGFSQSDLGIKSGLHRTYIGSIERGERNVSLLNIERIAKALDVQPRMLVASKMHRKTDDICIPGDGKLCSGMHIASIYKSREEQFMVLRQFLFDAVKNKEKCVCIANDGTREGIIAELAKRNISAEKCSEWGQFLILSHNDTYLKSGDFHSEKMVKMLKNMHQDALAEGFSGLRATGEVTHGLMNSAGYRTFIEYEARLNYFYPDTKAIGLCQYDEAAFTKECLLDVIFTHPYLFFHGRFMANPYYKQPSVFLAPQDKEDPSALYDTIRLELTSLAA